MKIKILSIGSKNPAWLEDLCRTYEKKISPMCPFIIDHIKSPEMDRDDKKQKLLAEEKLLLKHIDPSEALIVFSEEGKKFSSSVEFSNSILQHLGRQPGKICFIIGGPYGISDQIKERAKEVWSLSRLTLNHHLAQAVILEQIYRSLTIWKKIPYHN